MNHKTLKFTGRNSELEKIIRAWSRASNVKNPNPQLVLLKGERGVGKTRLVFEFYRWLIENNDSEGEKSGYWPDSMDIYQNAIDVNPFPRDCNFEEQMPYLWWGLRISDSRNPIDTISSYDSYLAPHLAVLLATSIKKRKGLVMAAALADLGIDLGISLLENLTYLGLIKRLVEGVKKGVDIVRDGINELSIEKALKVPQSRATSILEQLERVFSPTRDFASIPGVILIDDAQDIDTTKDPAILDFIERLFHNAINQKWPILIIVTHWKRELSSEVTPQNLSFAGLLRHCRQVDTSVLGPAAGLPSGFLNESNFIEIELGPVDNLSVALDEQLPGLTSEQSLGILNATGGNPRFLEQLVYFAKENAGFFVDFDATKSLTDSGYNELLLETKNQDIFRVVRRRLIDAPDEVKEAICLASLQGMRFANDLVNAIAQIQLSKDVQIPLEKAENPYSWIVGIKNKTNDGVGRFVEHLFYQVAKDLRPHLKSLGGESKLITSFKKIISDLVQDENFKNSDLSERQLIVYTLAADLFEKSNVPKEVELAKTAMTHIAKVHLNRNSLEAATAAYERLLKTPPSNDDSLVVQEWENRVRILDFLTASYRELNWPSKVSTAFKKLISMGYLQINDQNQRVFVFSRTPEEVKEIYLEWKANKLKNIRESGYFDRIQPKPDFAFIEKRLEEVYFSSVRVIVKAMLGLAELAIAWPSLTFDEGDDPIWDAPFMLKAFNDDENGNLKEEKDELQNSEISLLLKERAYMLGTLLGKPFADHEHFKLLVDDIAQSNWHKGNRTGAIGTLERALVIAKEMDSPLLQIQVLNNIGLIYTEIGELKKAESVLFEAGRLHNEKYSGNAFSVAVLSKKDRIEYRRPTTISSEEESKILKYIYIPAQLSVLFEQSPDEAVAQVNKLIYLLGNIESNLGLNFLQSGELDKAEKRFQNALESYADLNDGRKIAQTYTNFGVIAKQRNQPATACDWWKQSISVYEKLREIDNKDGKDNLWNKVIRELEILMKRNTYHK